MAFPSTPTNGQVETVGGITYTYNDTKDAWVRTPSVGTNISVYSTGITGTTPSVSTTSGALQVAGGVGVQGNVYAAKFIGDGSSLTNLPEGYTDSDVADYLPTHSGNVTANVITAARVNLTQPFYYNSRTVTANVTIGATENAMSAGPITIAAGVVVTVESGGDWTVV
jgi:hypothetical protein